MMQFTLLLNEETQRPVVTLKNWHRFSVMLDTGALFPIWVGDATILEKMNAVVVKEKVRFGGFGGDAYGTLYKIPYFQFGDLIYPWPHVVTHKMDLPCHMIVSATMFNDMIFEVDNRNHRLSVTIPDGESHVRNLIIRDENGKLVVLCTANE